MKRRENKGGEQAELLPGNAGGFRLVAEVGIDGERVQRERNLAAERERVLQAAQLGLFEQGGLLR